MGTKRTSKVQAPSMMAQVASIDFRHYVSARRSPSGWPKSIVSSASTLSVEDLDILEPETLQAANEKPTTKNSSRKAQSPDLTLKVDMEELQKLAKLRCTPLSLKDMYKYAVDFSNAEQRLRNAQFLHKELPIRIAQRAVDLLTLPHGLSDVMAIRQIAHIYLLYLEKFQEFPVPTTSEDEDKFTEMLNGLVLDRSSIPHAVAQGVDQWLQLDYEASHGEHIEGDRRLQEMEDALYRFFTARTGLRFLTEHHILSSPKRRELGRALRMAQSNFVDEDDLDMGFLGCIQTNCDPAKEVKVVASKIRQQTEDFYGLCPEIQIIDSSHKKDSNFTYVPHHLHYMVGELIKNSCRASVRKYLDSDKSQPIPPIVVVIVKGEEDVTIKVADRGGGIPRSKMMNVWKFAHSTAGEDEFESEFGVDAATGSKLRGFGLPLARIYARYLGGELTLKSMEGYGLDAYLHLPRLGEKCENLPLEVRFSPGELNSNPPRRAASMHTGQR